MTMFKFEVPATEMESGKDMRLIVGLLLKQSFQEDLLPTDKISVLRENNGPFMALVRRLDLAARNQVQNKPSSALSEISSDELVGESADACHPGDTRFHRLS